MPANNDVYTGTPPLQWGAAPPETVALFMYMAEIDTPSTPSVALNVRRIVNPTGLPTTADWDNAQVIAPALSPGTTEGIVSNPDSGDYNYVLRGGWGPGQILRYPNGDLLCYMITGNTWEANGGRADGRNRRIALATSSDNGLTWAWHPSNPIDLPYNLPSATAEAGAFDCAAYYDDTMGEILLYWAQMEEFSAGQVRMNMRLAVMDTDYVSVVSDIEIFPYTQPDIGIQTDEQWPQGVWKAHNRWHMYYGTEFFPMKYMSADDREFQNNRLANIEPLSGSAWSGYKFMGWKDANTGWVFIRDPYPRPSDVRNYEVPTSDPGDFSSIVLGPWGPSGGSWPDFPGDGVMFLG